MLFLERSVDASSRAMTWTTVVGERDTAHDFASIATKYTKGKTKGGAYISKRYLMVCGGRYTRHGQAID